MNDSNLLTDLTRRLSLRIDKRVSVLSAPRFVESSRTGGTIIVKVEDDYGRELLLTSRNGRMNRSSIRDAVYMMTRPCYYTDCSKGRDPNILDTEYNSDRDTRNAAPYGDTSALHTLVTQICDREGISRDLLDEVENPYGFNEVKDEVNRVVGRVVLHPYSDPSKYRFTQEGYSVVFEKVEEAKDSGK